MISSRRRDAVERVVATLRREFPGPKIAGEPCDVAQLEQVQALWDRGVAELGSIDIWVNNAARDTTKAPFFAVPVNDIVETVSTNLIGLMFCNRVAINGMYKQKGGWIWNMEGFGSNGQVRPTISVYGSTKYAVRYFTKAMVMELAKTPVKVGYLSPGIVLTDMLIPPPEQRGKRWEESKKILNILADTVETVTPYLVEGMLNAKESGAAVRWLTGPKVSARFLLARFRKRDVFTPIGA
jgi:short-subunit dehydrogenase